MWCLSCTESKMLSYKKLTCYSHLTAPFYKKKHNHVEQCNRYWEDHFLMICYTYTQYVLLPRQRCQLNTLEKSYWQEHLRVYTNFLKKVIWYANIKGLCFKFLPCDRLSCVFQVLLSYLVLYYSTFCKRNFEHSVAFLSLLDVPGRQGLCLSHDSFTINAISVNFKEL